MKNTGDTAAASRLTPPAMMKAQPVASSARRSLGATSTAIPNATARIPMKVISPRAPPGTTPAPIMIRPNTISPIASHAVCCHSGPSVRTTSMACACTPVLIRAMTPITVAMIPMIRATSWAGLHGGRSTTVRRAATSSSARGASETTALLRNMGPPLSVLARRVPAKQTRKTWVEQEHG
ncbi:MAG: hypothetical protein E6G57_14760 [Actinobacteria bacterium]|nr:MAG: hypothetical protein E6G57_14760 [Actinomycetota bacterium]